MSNIRQKTVNEDKQDKTTWTTNKVPTNKAGGEPMCSRKGRQLLTYAQPISTFVSF